MNYFDKVELKDEVYSLVYGNGTVNYVLDKKLRTEGFYTFQVQFTDNKVFYTTEGVPEWCSSTGCHQTVYYKSDLDKPESDFENIRKDLLSKKKIVKLKKQGKLEMRCPSGAWRNVEECPPVVVLAAIKYEEFYLFRKVQ